MPPMNTVTELARAFDVTPPTIRRWTSEFSDSLSDYANAPKGKTREYTDNDAAILAKVAEMRRVNADYETISAALADGDRGQWPVEPDQPAGPAQDAPGQDQNTFALVSQLTAKAANLEGELNATKQERDRLLDEVKEARQDAQDAAGRATIAETELRILKDLTEQKPPQEENLTWWQRVFGRR